jgi:hypothetical protein
MGKGDNTLAKNRELRKRHWDTFEALNRIIKRTSFNFIKEETRGVIHEKTKHWNRIIKRTSSNFNLSVISKKNLAHSNQNFWLRHCDKGKLAVTLIISLYNISNSTHVEILAILLGLQLALEVGSSHVDLEIDAQTMVSAHYDAEVRWDQKYNAKI